MRLRRDECPGGLTALQIRLRRMVRFLRHHGLIVPARELGSIMVGAVKGVLFDAGYMEHLMSIGSWAKADGYLQHFLPTPQYASPQSMSLVLHIRSAWTLAEVAAGGPTAAEFASNFDGCQGPVASSFRHILHKMHADQPRASKIWKNVAPSAVNKALYMLAECPELKGKLHLPRDRPKQWEVIPLFRTRASSSHRTKAADRTPTDVIVRALKRQKRSLSTLETDAYSEHQKDNGLSPRPDKQDDRTWKQSHD